MSIRGKSTDSRFVLVDGDIGRSIKILQRRLILSGDFRSMKRRAAYIKPGDQKRLDVKQGIRRTKKRLLKRLETLGY